jgi:uncharacterized membrane protein
MLPFGNGVVHVGSHLGALDTLWTVLLAILLAALLATFVVLIIDFLRILKRLRHEQSLAASPSPSAPTGLPVGPSEGLRILDERYARGEIDRDDYLGRRKDLTS